MLSVFKAKSQKELNHLHNLGVPIVKETISKLREVAASKEFRKQEHLR
jgi:hypothetical protein